MGPFYDRLELRCRRLIAATGRHQRPKLLS